MGKTFPTLVGFGEILIKETNKFDALSA